MNIKILKIRLQTILWVILVIAVLAEIAVLYVNLFSAADEGQAPGGGTAAEVIKINAGEFEKLRSWLEARESYTLPPAGVGNPFAEYR